MAESGERSSCYVLNLLINVAMFKISDVEKLAAKYDVAFTLRANGHVQLKGDLLVNYYPESSKQTAYVAGTTKGRRHTSPKDAIAMCFSAPEYAPQHQRDKRRAGASRRQRAALLKKGVNTCFWCGVPVDLDSSTIEHKIPLARGGLDNANNRTLACKKCNHERGDCMPELKK